MLAYAVRGPDWGGCIGDLQRCNEDGHDEGAGRDYVQTSDQAANGLKTGMCDNDLKDMKFV